MRKWWLQQLPSVPITLIGFEDWARSCRDSARRLEGKRQGGYPAQGEGLTMASLSSVVSDTVWKDLKTLTSGRQKLLHGQGPKIPYYQTLLCTFNENLWKTYGSKLKTRYIRSQTNSQAWAEKENMSFKQGT